MNDECGIRNILTSTNIRLQIGKDFLSESNLVDVLLSSATIPPVVLRDTRGFKDSKRFVIPSTIIELSLSPDTILAIEIEAEYATCRYILKI